MKKPSPLFSIAIRYGAIAGVLCSVLLMITYYLVARHPLMVSPFMDFRVLLFAVFIFFSLKEFRDYHQQGELYFSQGMLSSFVFVLIAGTLASLLLWIFCALESTFIPSYVTAMQAYLKTFPPEDIERIGKEVFESNVNGLSATNGKQIAAKYFIQSVMIGFFVSIILSVILRKEPKTP
jgi:hypothetical protein